MTDSERKHTYQMTDRKQQNRIGYQRRKGGTRFHRTSITSPASSPIQKPREKKKRWYVVYAGQTPGVYETWDEC